MRMSSLHCVVVWEWLAGEGAWLPHGPGVARTLERAHAKRLTRVVLADAEPALRGHTVNLRTLTQSSEAASGVVERPVRRATYSVHSPGGRGARWEWANKGSTRYDPLPMSAQCALEDAWAAGEGTCQLDGWTACLARMELHAVGARARVLRRALQPPYPLARAPHAPPLPQRHQHDGSNRTIARIPQQHTGSSVHSVQSTQSTISARSTQSNHSTLSARSNHSTQSAPVQRRPRSVSPKERRGRGLARQILNIFSHKEEARRAGSAERAPPDSGRRHSVDTVSTYLSHESKDSLQSGQVGSVGELLNVSAGSDDVFAPREADVCIPCERDAGAVEASEYSAWAVLVARPQWGAVCPWCLHPLQPSGTGAPPVLQLTSCHHQLHQPCLTTTIQETGRLECMVCGERYPPSAPPPAGPQPSGSMAWSVQGASLPTHPTINTIVVTYNFQSGRQTTGHPAPGAPYYAVGFPRHSVLPATILGHKVLELLVAAWGGSRLFTVLPSQTTGREHVVAWRVAPPPASRRAYATLTQERADAELQAALNRLRTLMGQPAEATDV